MHASVGIRAEQKAWRRVPRIVQVPGAGIDAPLRIGYAVVQVALFTVSFHGERHRLRASPPGPESPSIRQNESSARLKSKPIDLKSFLHELMASFVPEIAVEAFAVDIRPVKRRSIFIPVRAFAAEVAVVRNNFHLWLHREIDPAGLQVAVELITMVEKFYYAPHTVYNFVVNETTGIPGARLQKRVALVSGAGMGIGKAIATLFAKEGARVAAIDINTPAGVEAEREINASGGRCVFIRADVSDEQQVEAAVQSAVSRLGPIDVLLNVAGIAHESPAHLLKLEDWQRTLNVNLTGMFLLAKHVIPGMLKLGRGAIVNISSVQGLFGFPGYPHYAASKGGIISLTRQMAREYASAGIRVNCIAPGTVDTPMNEEVLARADDPEALRAAWNKMHPLGRFGQPRDIAQGALFLASDESSWITGQCLAIDGGLSCAVLNEEMVETLK